LKLLTTTTERTVVFVIKKQLEGVFFNFFQQDKKSFPGKESPKSSGRLQVSKTISGYHRFCLPADDKNIPSALSRQHCTAASQGQHHPCEEGLVAA